MKKWILIGIAVFFIALILISRYFVFKSTFAMGKIRSVVESTLKDQLKREFILGEITGDPFLGVTINGLSVAKHDKLSEGKLVEMKMAKLDREIKSAVEAGKQISVDEYLRLVAKRFGPKRPGQKGLEVLLRHFEAKIIQRDFKANKYPTD